MNPVDPNQPAVGGPGATTPVVDPTPVTDVPAVETPVAGGVPGGAPVSDPVTPVADPVVPAVPSEPAGVPGGAPVTPTEPVVPGAPATDKPAWQQ